jgi:CMP-N,N'-diacetyllegionaminic acid synthase
VQVLWLITARSGSRSVPDKNILPLGGHPLLAYRIAVARTLAGAENVWLSTDSERYAEIGRAYGASIPFLRPPELSTDATPSVDVVLHAMAHAARQGRSYEVVALLEPTSPFVLPSSLQHAIELMMSTARAHATVATRLCRPSSFYIQPETAFLTELAQRIGYGPPPRRQDERTEVTPSGGFAIARWQPFLERPSFYTEHTLGYRVSEAEALEIDEPIDFDWAEFLISSSRVDLPILGLNATAAAQEAARD